MHLQLDSLACELTSAPSTLYVLVISSLSMLCYNTFHLPINANLEHATSIDSLLATSTTWTKTLKTHKCKKREKCSSML